MKRLLISLTLLGISIGFCLFSYTELKSMSNELDYALLQCADSLQNEDPQEAKEKIENINTFWDSKKVYYKILVDGSFFETINNCIDSINFCIDIKEYAEAQSSINDCRNVLRQILENEKLSLEVIL